MCVVSCVLSSVLCVVRCGALCVVRFALCVLGTSGFLSEMVFKLDEDKDASKLDGCQFPKINYADTNPDTKYDNPAYSPGNEYLRVWDTFDCKITRALGYGPEVSVPNLVLMILGGLLTGGLGVLFFVGAFFFAFVIISIAVRALHIFLISSTAVVIMLYVSPLMIVLAMFEKTKGMFEKWWKQILGFVLQPMILFAYLGVLITIMDNVFMDVSFLKLITQIPILIQNMIIQHIHREMNI